MAEITWIKLTINMFDDEKIKIIQAMPESDSIIIIWIRLLTLAGKTNDDGRIYIDEDLPYTDEMLATLFNKPLNTIRLAIETLRRFKMVETNDEGHIEIVNWEKHQNIDGMDRIKKLNAEKQKRYRDRKKLEQLRLEQGENIENAKPLRNDNVTHDGTSPNRIREDIDRDKDKEIKEDSRKPAKRVYDASTDYYQLSKFLFEKMQENNPEVKEPNLNSWADHIRKMEELDGRTPKQIRNMIIWSQQDSFWKGNILSTQKLREKYDQMRVQALEETNKPKSKTLYGNRNPKVEQQPEWMNEDQPKEETELDASKQAVFNERLNKFRGGKASGDE